MGQKIVLLPLDERPCNAAFPVKLFYDKDVCITSLRQLGDKKEPANQAEIEAFLLRECKEADGLLLSMDMLLYGGLLPSRLHSLSKEEVEKRLQLLYQLKKENPKLVIYAFQCIMRCPSYSSSDEEPDYYEAYGKEIHQSGKAKHRCLLGECDKKEEKEIFDKIPNEYLTDYVDRRAFNLGFSIKTLQLVKENIVDFLVIPQDDSAPYGYTALDQQKVRKAIIDAKLQMKVLMYPGADEVALTLLSRMLLSFEKKKPNVFVKYASTKAPQMIPAYEDRLLAETVKYHLMAAGCRQVDSFSEADFVLAINAPSQNMKEASVQPIQEMEYTVERNITEFVAYLKDCIERGKPVSVCDNAYANGGEIELITMMQTEELLLQVAGYAGWNTSSNTMGTALAEGVRHFLKGMDEIQQKFLCLRYLEDVGYCSIVRKHITETKLEALGMDYFNVREELGQVSELVKEELIQFMEEYVPSIAQVASVSEVKMPWRRMFEVDITL